MFILNRNEFDPSVINMPDEMIFEELNMYLNSLNVFPYMTIAYSKANSCFLEDLKDVYKIDISFPSVPALVILLKSKENIDLDLEALKEEWKRLLVYHFYDKDAYYSEDMPIYFLDGDSYIIEQYVRNFKIDISDFLNDQHIKPLNVYCSSLPSYNIIYADQKDYDEASKNFDFFSYCIKEHLKELIQKDFDINNININVNYYNKEMSDYHAYELQKEL